MENNDWNEYKQLFLHEVEENSKRFDKVFETLQSLREDVGGLKVKAAIAGGTAGLIGTGIVSTLFHLWK